ncbi:MarR family winged helix-turn-helix transcriptional regulator [Acetobacterium tundrae]|uniref:MarR family winged helix-turn-helix transcriptional regulator n=1 Tax=Acetobacterium tundrae TaxID=132932 RepID=UPI001FAA287C|nr:MarR family transcriptional regulator [Acetobacterium tundrae]
MKNIDAMADRQFVFGSVQIVSNQMNTLLERDLKEQDLTAKQWFLTAIIQKSFDYAPTIKETAEAMGNSHQNVKQVALKLAQKGFLTLEKDEKDARVTRIKLTAKIDSFRKETQFKASNFTKNLFDGISEDEMATTRSVLEKMLSNLEKMENGGQIK